MRYYVGLMSGTSLDGVDGVLVEIDESGTHFKLLAASYLSFSSDVRAALLALQSNGLDEIHLAKQAANQLVLVYAECVLDLLKTANIPPSEVIAIGAHGQTVRHRPEFGYTLQINNPALLAELTDIDVIADFRNRDIAAGGQGAPLVPSFHRKVFGKAKVERVIANIGGISNISILHADGKTRGFDTGPGNVLMDMWIMRHQGQHYDTNGEWARQGKVNCDLLASLKDESFLHLAPPKSTGRDLFNSDWLKQKLARFSEVSAVDVQATLCAFTAHTLVDAINAYAPEVQELYICGGGAFNATLVDAIKSALSTNKASVSVESTEVLGVSPNHVEAMAFAWLANRFTNRLTGNLPEVTGASGERILGALYPR
jgi:anhydro-N-acetylmuramic acid kinase